MLQGRKHKGWGSRVKFHSVLLIVLAWAITGCSGRQAASYPSATASDAPPVDLSTAGSISGTVTLSGSPPTMQRIDTSSDPNCHPASPLIPQTVMVGPHGELANVVVYVKSGLGNYRFATPSAPAVLDQKGCMYDPHVVGLMVNQPLQIMNDDMTVHNVHLVPKINSSWNRSQPVGSQPVVSTFSHPELAIPIMCNVHPWMRSYLFVFAHPYFAVTTATGEFHIKDLPPGNYTIEAWQEKFGVIDRSISIAPRQSSSASFTFSSSNQDH